MDNKKEQMDDYDKEVELFAQGGNAGEARKKIFGTSSSPTNPAMREKHINHLKEFAKKLLGLELQPSGGKINEKTGERRSEENEVGVDKPDWHSGSLESQWNPDAITHELAHLLLLPKGVGLKEGQKLMDKQYSEVQKKYGYMKQKRSQGEIQPMAAEQLIRRHLGLPANQNAVPVKEGEGPRVTVEDPTMSAGIRVKKGKKTVDLIRQSRFLSPENKERIEHALSGKLKFHPEYGWQENPNYLGAKTQIYKDVNKPIKEAKGGEIKHSPLIRKLADAYAAAKGLKLKHDDHTPLNEERGKAIAQEFEAMKHNPTAPHVKRAYDALINETLDQYQMLKKAGLKLTPITEGMANPYHNSHAMLKDVRENNHLYFYPTDLGFGGKDDKTSDHPLLQPTKETVGKHKMVANDIFRVVHDYFGHAKEGNGFGPKGEEQAWQHHKQMYSPDAQKALTTETRGQNSWVNFGPKGEANRANPAATQYAEQKAGLMPAWTNEITDKTQKFAEGGFISDADFATIQTPATEAPTSKSLTGQPAHMTAPEGFIPDSQFQSMDSAYGGVGQTIKAGLEGASQGLAGPLGPLAETESGLATKEDIRGRAAAHPIAKGIGEVGGFIGGAFTGASEAALMSRAGEAAKAASGIGKATYGARVGAEAVKQAAEMAVMAGSDEIAKRVIEDPSATAENAIANIGLMSVLGAGTGAFTAGAISPIWKATAGPKVEQFLNMTKNYINGGSKLVMEGEAEAAAKILGIELNPVMRSGMSEDATAKGFFGDLRRGEHPAVLESVRNVHNDISNSVMNSLGITTESVAGHSENVAGHELQEVFQNEVKTKYDPRAAEMQARDAEAAPLHVSDDARLHHSGKMVEKGIETVGTDSPYFKEYQHYAERLLAKDTIGGIDKLKTEINGRIKAAYRSGDDNAWRVLSDIKNSLGDLQTQYIEHAATQADKVMLERSQVPGLPKVPGQIESFKPTAADLIARRTAANQNYAKYANTMDTMMENLGLGSFKGTQGLISKVTEKLSPEELLKKFTIKGNSDLIPFMQEHFPDTFAKILENERKQMVKPAILQAAKKGENPIDVKKLSEIISKAQAGKPEYVKAVLPEQTIQRVEAGRKLANAIPQPRDSGTPAGMQKLFRMMPANAVAAISWAMGHGILGGLMAGEMAQRLGKDAPEAIKLSYLRFLSSDQPVKAEGFKSMVDFLHSTYKGQNALATAAANVFKPGFEVFTQGINAPTAAELAKLDKLVAKNQEDPNQYLAAQDESTVGHYLPQHQLALTQSSAQAIQYLNNLKPVPTQTSPLDKPIEPTKMQEARYNRALTIAQQPAVVLQHIKDGTLQTTDIQDLEGMYPALRAQMAQKLTNEMINRHSDEEPVPYKTRVSVSLFLGQPLDTSMLPTSIMAAQPQPVPPPQQQPGKVKSKGSSTQKMGKTNNSYRTPNQAAESDRSGRD